MNIQALMKQAQQMQKDLMKEKEEIDKKFFVETYSMVTVEMTGNKHVQKITISKDVELSSDDIEMLEDSIAIAVNKLIEKIDQETENKLGKYGQGLNGLM